MTSVSVSYRRLVEGADDIIYWCDRLGRVTETNDAAARILGAPNQELVGRHFLEFIHEDDRARVRSLVRDQLVLGTPSQYMEVPIVTASGEARWVGQHLQLVFDNGRDDGRITGTQAIARDITRRVRAERELRRSEERLEVAVEAAGLGLWYLDLRSDEIEVNDEWLASLGYERGDIAETRQGMEALIHPDDVPQLAATLEHHLSGAASYFEAELRMKHADGAWRWVLSRGRVTQRDDQGHPRRLSGTQIDVTRRKKVERDLIESKHRIERLYEVISTPADTTGEQVHACLELTTNVLGLEFGVLSHIEDEIYTVDACYAPGGEVAPGDEFDLGHTYCSIPLAADSLVSIDYMAKSEYRGRACYGISRLESYIGVPVRTGRSTSSVLCFAGKQPRHEPFSDSEENFVRMVAGWVSTALENRTARAELEESERKFRSAFDYAAIGKALVSREGAWIEVNEALCNIVGYSAQELFERTFQDITHPADLDKDLEMVRKVLERTIDSYDIEKRYIHKDGHVVWVALGVSAVYDADGEVSYFIAQIQDVSQQKEMEQRLVRQAELDGLTGLPNRTVFNERMRSALDASRREARSGMAVLYVDFDRFKIVNDTLGHTAGDRLLVETARRLETCIRETDTIARLGGDEFGILIPGAPDRETVTEVAERIKAELATPILIEGYDIYPAVSIGIVLDDGRYVSPEEMLRDADTAMYAAKAGGGADYEVFSTQMHLDVAARLQLDSELRKAIQNGEFTAFYQPIVDLRTGAIAGFEALARWRHPERGIVVPGDFIEEAERLGLIKWIDRAVLEQACDSLRRWSEKSDKAIQLVMHVNCSAQHLLDATLSELADEILSRTSLDPSLLMLELTESVLIEDIADAGEQIRRLREKNVSMCIDDFGTGYSSLNALHSLPIDAVKIDRAFIRDMFNQGRRQRMVQTIIDIADSLEMDVIAEGIETFEQLDELRLRGCAHGQGFVFSEPLPEEDVEAFLDAEPPWIAHWTR